MFMIYITFLWYFWLSQQKIVIENARNFILGKRQRKENLPVSSLSSLPKQMYDHNSALLKYCETNSDISGTLSSKITLNKFWDSEILLKAHWQISKK